MPSTRTDRYLSYVELARQQTRDRDYAIVVMPRPGSPVAVIAPHGGRIEHGTSELARCIAGDEYGFYAFEGYKARGQNRDLHITSHRFDEPQGLALVARADVVIAVHGCIGRRQICVGGLDTALAERLTVTLAAAGLPAIADGHRYPAHNPLNICNRGRRGCGAQLEFTSELREPMYRAVIARAVRAAISSHLIVLAQSRAAS
jgi:phage replication-related protein YjqB (UPF0714/DUF867 family)